MCICNATQRNATQRNATQRNAYQNYILTNNFKFYILQFFRAVNFLSAVFGFAKISSLIKNSFVKNSLSLRVKRSNLNLVKFNFYNLISLINKFYTKWIATPMPKALLRRSRLAMTVLSWAMTIKNNFAIFNYAFSFDAFNFEIISQLNYGFCYKNYFFNLNQLFRNSYDFGERFERNLNYDFGKNCSGGFGKNYFGNCNFGYGFGNEIYSIWHDLNGFLFNRKTKKINLCQRIALAKENKNEENSSNNSSFAFYGKRKRFWYVWG